MRTSRLKAIYIAKNLPISKIKGQVDYKEVTVTKETAIYSVGDGVIYLYSFGSIVLMGMTDEQERGFIAKLGELGISLKENPITEDYEVLEDPKARAFIVTNSKVILKKLEPGMLKVIARVLAQSVALESYEYEFDSIEERFAILNSRLEKYGRLKMSAKDVMKMIAKNNSVIEEIVSGIGVLEKPEAAWESHLVDALHNRLAGEFELVERFKNIESKMGFIQENYKVILESLRNRDNAILEWIIIILIAVEILLFVFELFKSGMV